jgi:hypothetical protein
VQARPVCGETGNTQPNQPGIPAITFGDAPHQFSHEKSRDREDDEKTELPPDAVPIEQDDR